MAAFKPAVTGLDEPAGEWPRDHELLAAAASAGQTPDEIAPYRFGPAVSPHLVAELCGTAIDAAELVAAARAAEAASDALVVEGVGGFAVPLTSDYLVRDLAVELALPVVVVARPGLGTINHTLLTVEAVRAARVRPAAVVMTPWPERPTELERSNRETVERLAQMPVSGAPPARPESLAATGALLPIDDWL